MQLQYERIGRHNGAHEHLNTLVHVNIAAVLH